MHKQARRTILAIVVLLHCFSADAQPLAVDAEVRQRERLVVEQRERQRQERAPRISLQPASPAERVEAMGLPVELPCYEARRFSLELPPGARGGGVEHELAHFHFLMREVQGFAGACIGVKGLEWLLKRLQQGLLDAGYTTTKVGLVEQTLGGGVITFSLIPGVIGEVRIEGGAQRLRRSAFPARAGDLLNIRDLEQGLEQIKRLGNADVDMQIVPGELLGQSDVVVRVKTGFPLVGSLGLSDAGQASMGKYQFAPSVTWFNPLQVADVLSLSASGSRLDGVAGSASQSWDYSVPWGYWTFAVSGSQGRHAQKVVGPYQTFVYSGKYSVNELRAERVLYRSQVRKVSGEIRVANRKSSSYVDATEILIQKRHNASFEASLMFRRYFETAQLDLKLTRRWGVPWFGAQRDESADPEAPRHLYRLNSFEASASIPFSVAGKSARLRSSLRGQSADTPLYASEWLSLGNRWTVRGFDGAYTVGAENGMYLRNELEMPIAAGGSLLGYLGWDGGYVQGKNAPVKWGSSLVGVAIGLRGAVARRVNFDVSLGWPLRRPQNFPCAGVVGAFSVTLSI